MKLSIEKPIIIGKNHNQAEMAWAWWHEHHARLAIVGDSQLSPRKEMIKSIAGLIHGRDSNAVFWITDDPKSSLSEVYPIQSIPWVEQFPDPPKEIVDRDIFIANRKFFSSSFFSLLAQKKGILRKDLFPPTSYQGHIEGPMGGYIRAIQTLEDEDKKTWLMNEIMDLENVYWYKTKDGGRKFYLNSEGEYQKALSFLVAAWSFWAYTCELEEAQQMLLIIEPPKEFLMAHTDPMIQEIIVEALRILNNLSVTTTTTVILSSETFNPIPFHNYRYRVIFQTKDSDIDLSTPENKKAIQMPSLYNAWEMGNDDKGLWEDNHTGERFVLSFSGEDVSFWDDYEDGIRQDQE
ncbi:hypothetical protein [Ammoniphilus resinae]|uniref:Uncharacterized protein n=1 Tax=Ammoniphilus resinae TaxID=861532 RepID=A0ABS4GPN4_9BACL|nr:hypothetical protein [Ammoniphilus resinae]MBP1931825.1 hypothetical protein [Ammoniphilus resinae]